MCINSDGYEFSLVVGKVYKIIKPEKNDRAPDFRVIDEEGEDYLYDARRFVEIELPRRAQRHIGLVGEPLSRNGK